VVRGFLRRARIEPPELVSANDRPFRPSATSFARLLVASILLFSVAVLLSCGGVTQPRGGGTPPPSGGGGTPATPGFVDVANTNSNNITGLKVDPASGASGARGPISPVMYMVLPSGVITGWRSTPNRRARDEMSVRLAWRRQVPRHS
jgi:hypothetical protein